MRRLLTSTVLCLSLAACDRADEKAEQERLQQQIDGMYLKGTTEYLQGNFDVALAAFQQVRNVAPDDPRLPAATGEVYLSQGRLNEALEQFELASRLEPTRGTNFSRLGYIHAQKGHREEAKRHLHHALKLGPTDFNAMENLGDLAAKEGNVDDAVAWLRKAIPHAPEIARPLLYLRAAQILEKAGREAEAIPILKEGVVLAPAGELFVELGDLQVKSGDFPGALESYRAAARAMPKDPTLWELVAELQLKLDKPGDAEASYRESLRVEDRAIIHVALARLHLQRGNRPAAETELGLALKSYRGEEERESTELAELLATMGRKADALKLLSTLASEEELHTDVALQRRVAALAKDVGDVQQVSAACERVKKADAKSKCP